MGRTSDGWRLAAVLACALGLAAPAAAAELDYAYWRAGEGADYAALAAAAASGDALVDSGIDGDAAAADAAVLNRLLGGSPPAALRLVTGKAATEMVRAGLMTDLTEPATQAGWAAGGACTYDGKVYCLPVSAGGACVTALFFPAHADPAMTAAQFRLASAVSRLDLPARYPAPDCPA